MVQAPGPPAAVGPRGVWGPAVRCRPRERFLPHVAAALRHPGHDGGKPELLRALHSRRPVHLPPAPAPQRLVDRVGHRGARLRAVWVDRLLPLAWARRQAVRVYCAAARVPRAGARAPRPAPGGLSPARGGGGARAARSLPARVLPRHRRRLVRPLLGLRRGPGRARRGAPAPTRDGPRRRAAGVRNRRHPDRAVLRLHPVLTPCRGLLRVCRVDVLRHSLGPRPGVLSEELRGVARHLLGLEPAEVALGIPGPPGHRARRAGRRNAGAAAPHPVGGRARAPVPAHQSRSGDPVLQAVVDGDAARQQDARTGDGVFRGRTRDGGLRGGRGRSCAGEGRPARHDAHLDHRSDRRRTGRHRGVGPRRRVARARHPGGERASGRGCRPSPAVRHHVGSLRQRRGAGGDGSPVRARPGPPDAPARRAHTGAGRGNRPLAERAQFLALLGAI